MSKFNLYPGAVYALLLKDGSILQLQFRIKTAKGDCIFGNDNCPQVIPYTSIEKCEEIEVFTPIEKILEQLNKY